MDSIALAEILYDVYCHAVGGKAFNNDPLPKWQEFFNDPKKQTQVKGWLAVGKAACVAFNDTSRFS